MSERAWWWTRGLLVTAAIAIFEVLTDVFNRLGWGWALLACFGVGLGMAALIDVTRWSYRQAATRDKRPT